MRHLCLAIVLFGPVAVLAAEPATVPLFSHPDEFETLVNPPCSHCRIEAERRSGELRENDRVLCWIRGYSDGGAIPFRFFLNSYRVISDTYGVFVYDADAGFARGFAPSLDFTFHGWRNGVMVIKHKDGTLYSSLTGKAFEGPQKGTKLEAVPTLVSNWGDWLKRYPDAVAYHMFDKYQAKDRPEKEHEVARKSRGEVDPRMDGDELVLGVTSGDVARVYRLQDIRKRALVREKIAGQDWVIFWNDPTETAAAYVSVAEPADDKEKPRPVTLKSSKVDATTTYVDDETGSHWDIAGRAIEGELKGWTLKWLDGTQVKWFAWSAEYPETSIYDATRDSHESID